MEPENDLNLKKFITQPQYVMYIINNLIIKFNTELFKKYNGSNYKDAVAYYRYGKCPSFAYILSQIFGEQYCTFYDDFCSQEENKDGHVYTKLGDYFFDVTGYYESLPSRYINSSYDNFLYIAELYCAKDEYMREIEEELIIYGTELLQETMTKLLGEEKGQAR